MERERDLQAKTSLFVLRTKDGLLEVINMHKKEPAELLAEVGGGRL